MPPRKKASPKESLGLERIVFFSDAVMAIAITLLAIDLKIPDVPASSAITELPKQLAAIKPNLITFLISFIVIGIYWMSHHRYFGYIQRYDTRLMILNLLFLFFIACMPFVASLQGHYSYVPIALVLYTLDAAALGLMMALIWWYASTNHRLIADDLDASTIRTVKIRLSIAPIMFLIAVPFAYVSTTAVILIWWVAPLVVIAVTRIFGKQT